MQTKENSFADWTAIGEAVTKSLKSIRQIARENGLSDTAIRKEIKRRGWTRPTALAERREPPCARPLEIASRSVAGSSVPALTSRGRSIILDLMAELEFLNQNHQTLCELVEDYVNGTGDQQTRAKLMRALNHETRAKSANYLAAALAKLNDATPGKKEQAQAEAENAGKGSQWEDDLEVPGRPN